MMRTSSSKGISFSRSIVRKSDRSMSTSDLPIQLSPSRRARGIPQRYRMPNPSAWENSGGRRSTPEPSSAPLTAVRDEIPITVEAGLGPSHERRQERRGRSDQRAVIGGGVGHPPHVDAGTARLRHE